MNGNPYNTNQLDVKKSSKRAIVLSLITFAIVSFGAGVTIFALQQKNIQDNKLLALNYSSPISGMVLGAKTNVNQTVKIAVYSKELDPDQDGLNNKMEEILGTDPNNPDTDKDGKKDGYEMNVGDDPTSLGKINTSINIPKIKITAPVIWSASTDEASIQKDLQKGVIHYPGTSMPGQTGNSFITGHSSDYSWTKGNYKNIFSNLHKLNVGDSVKIEYNLHNGRRITYEYKIISEDIVMPNDSRLFEKTNKKILTLVTCWPLNSSWKRLMFKAVLVE